MKLHLHRGTHEPFGPAAFVAEGNLAFVQGNNPSADGLALHINPRRKLRKVDARFARLSTYPFSHDRALRDARVAGDITLAHFPGQFGHNAGESVLRTLAEAGQNRVSTPCEVGVREEIKAAEPDECAVCSINRLPLNLISFVAPLHGEPLGFEALVDPQAD